MKSLSGAIIAGGKSTRMGVDKASILMNQQTFLQKAIALISSVTNPVFISSNTAYPAIDLHIIKDQFKDIGPISGIYSILQAIPTQKVLLIPVDTPLLSREVIHYILDNYNVNKQINICKTSDGLQMLVGVFDKSILPILEKQINNKDYKLSCILELVSTQIIDVDRFKDQFININTKNDLANLKSKTN